MRRLRLRPPAHRCGRIQRAATGAGFEGVDCIRSLTRRADQPASGAALPRRRAANDGARGVILVDAHVHAYPCFDAARQLAAAHRNFARHAQRLQPGNAWAGALLLSESHGHHWFANVAASAGDPAEQSAVAGWAFHATAERESLLARNEAGARLYIIDGRQVVTRERLEVLALCCSIDLSDGSPLAEVVDTIRDAGGLAVIPWGAGKWWFARGAVLERCLREHPDILLGDNANRPAVLPVPRPFGLARELDVPILPGSDPLPIPGAEEQTGSFGFVLPAAPSTDSPAATIRRGVQAGTIVPFGSLQSAGRFVTNQLRIGLAGLAHKAGAGVARR